MSSLLQTKNKHFEDGEKVSYKTKEVSFHKTRGFGSRSCERVIQPNEDMEEVDEIKRAIEQIAFILKCLNSTFLGSNLRF